MQEQRYRRRTPLKAVPTLGTALRGMTFATCFLALSACTASFRNHGYTPNPEDLANIIVGVDTRASVEDSLGRPTTGGVASTLGEATPSSGLFYVSSEWRHFAWKAPQITNREVVVVSLDANEVVTNIERFTLEDGRVVPLERRVTDNAVRNTTFLRQLLGNIGNFNPGALIGSDG